MLLYFSDYSKRLKAYILIGTAVPLAMTSIIFLLDRFQALPTLPGVGVERCFLTDKGKKSLFLRIFCLIVSLSYCLFVLLSLCLIVSLSYCLFVLLSLCLIVSLSLSVCLFCLSLLSVSSVCLFCLSLLSVSSVCLFCLSFSLSLSFFLSLSVFILDWARLPS
jgi:hypothetical protein